MRPTIRLGTISGIAIGLHWSIAAIGFVLVSALTGTVLPGLVPGLSGAAYFMAALATALLFLGSIIAHELGHSIVAQRNDIGVRGITLFALGGVAALEREPDDPGAAARIALAGPAVSVAIGVVALVVSNLMSSLGFGDLTTAAFFWLGLINLALAVFNMIPALPLDGGRVLQAVLWKRTGERHQATISAAKLGRWLGWAIVAVGVWQFTQSGTGLWTALIGWFVVMSAKARACGPVGRFVGNRLKRPATAVPSGPSPTCTHPLGVGPHPAPALILTSGGVGRPPRPPPIRRSSM